MKFNNLQVHFHKVQHFIGTVLEKKRVQSKKAFGLNNKYTGGKKLSAF